MKIDTSEITSVIKQEVERFATELEVSQVGQVIEIGDGIARVYGLSEAMAGEMVEIDTPEGVVRGQVMNLEQDVVGVVIFGDYLKVKEGMSVKATGTLLSVPVGEGMLGRVVNARDPQGGHHRPRHRGASARDPADADRREGRRLDDPDRSRPARADHRRP